MNIGDWVHTVCNQEKITGFITEFNTIDIVTILVTGLNNNGEYLKCKRNELIESNKIIHPDDLASLLDVSLFLHEKEWFEDWYEEKEKWKPVVDFLI